MIENYEINSLKEHVSAIFDEKSRKNHNNEIIEADIEWNYSLFVAQFLAKSVPSLQLNKDTLLTEIDGFNKSFSTAISLESLQENQWIRFIFDNVEIPHSLFWFCKDIKEKKDVDVKYLSYFDELHFIGTLYQRYGYNDTRPFRITKKDFCDIYNKFRYLYPKLPSKETLFKQFHFEEESDSYSYTPFKFHSVCSSKIAAYLWTLLDDTDIEKKIKQWVTLIQEFFIVDFLNFLPTNQKFLYSESIINLLLNEPDLIYETKVEIKKILSDSHRIGHSSLDVFFYDSDLNYPDTDNYLLLWNYFDRNYYIDVFSQECRELYAKILFSLLSDNDDNSNKCINKILSAKKKIPYLFFQILFYLKRNKVSQLLNFIDEDEYGIIFYFEFINKCFEELNNQQKKALYTTIINIMLESVDLLIDTNFKSYNIRLEQFSYILLYFIRLRFSPDRRVFLMQNKKYLYSYAISKLSEHYRSKNLIKKKSELLNFFFQIKDDFLSLHNSFDSMGIRQFAFLFNLLKFSDMSESLNSLNDIFEKIEELYIQNFLKATKLFCTDEYNQIEEFHWNKLINFLMNHYRLESFCLSIFNYLNFTKLKENDYDRLKTNADKLRLHLKILCIAYQQNLQEGISNTILENYIYEILCHSFVDDNKSKKISIFNSLYENHFIGEINTSIFQFVVTVVNDFSAQTRDKFLSLLKKEGNFSLLFKTYNSLRYLEDKKVLENFIKNKDFSENLEEIYSIPDFIEVASDVINSRLNGEFSNLVVNELVNIMADKANKGNLSHYTYIAEELKLYQLFKNGEKDSLSEYIFPYEDKTQQFKKQVNILNAEKLFYLSLFDLEDDKKSACKKLQKLCKDFPKNLKYKMYLLYVESYECSDDNNSSIRKKYLDEIDELLKQDIFNKGILFLSKIHLLVLDNQIEKALYFFESLDVEYRTDIAFAKLLIEALVKKELYKEATELFQNISSDFYNDKDYIELRKLISTDDYILKLKQNYGEILNLSEEERFKVLPARINNHTADLGLFILNEIKYALNKTLKKIDVVEKISENHLSEDNISDLLELEINGRLSMLGYKLENQDRSGKSASGINAGEIDLEINFNDFSIVIEAVKYSSGSAKRKQHIEKTFNYDPSRKFIYDLIYFDGTESFYDAWNNVLADINNASYPVGYEKKSFEELNSNNNGIKIAKSYHNNDLIFYHIMGNFKNTGT